MFFNQNICCGCSKEPSQWDGSFEHPKHMFEFMVQNKKTIIILHSKNLLIWTYANCLHFLMQDIEIYQLLLILTALLHVDLINVAYLTACTFIRLS